MNSGAQGTEAASDLLFERQWAESLVESALQGLAAEFENEGKGALFRETRVFVQGGSEPLPPYEDLASRLSMQITTARTHVSRLRTRYRERLRAELRRVVGTEEEVDGELRELLRLLTGR